MPNPLEALRNFAMGTPETQSGKNFMYGFDQFLRGADSLYDAERRSEEEAFRQRQEQERLAMERMRKLQGLGSAIDALGDTEGAALAQIDLNKGGVQEAGGVNMIDPRLSSEITDPYEKTLKAFPGKGEQVRGSFAEGFEGVAMPSGITPQESAMEQFRAGEAQRFADVKTPEQFAARTGVLGDKELSGIAEDAFTSYQDTIEQDTGSILERAQELEGNKNETISMLAATARSLYNSGDVEGAADLISKAQDYRESALQRSLTREQREKKAAGDSGSGGGAIPEDMKTTIENAFKEVQDKHKILEKSFVGVGPGRGWANWIKGKTGNPDVLAFEVARKAATGVITKAIQGSRPSDFDHKVYESMIPNTHHTPEQREAMLQTLGKILEIGVNTDNIAAERESSGVTSEELSNAMGIIQLGSNADQEEFENALNTINTAYSQGERMRRLAEEALAPGSPADEQEKEAASRILGRKYVK